MILSFSTQINGKPTYFQEKIWCGLIDKNIVDPELFKDYNRNFLVKDLSHKPKYHSIRIDIKNRWKQGMMIDFFINARQKNMFQFAPKINMISKQRIFMTYMPHLGNGFEVSVDGRQLANYEIENLAINDGFENVIDFEDYFIAQMVDDQYSGKIIHWTDLKY